MDICKSLEWINKKISIHYDENKIKHFSQTRNEILLDTNDLDIKILIVWKKETMILAIIEESKIWKQNYDKYILSNILDKTIIFEWIRYRPISTLSQADFIDSRFNIVSKEHLWIETIDDYKWIGIASEMLKMKQKIDWFLWRSFERKVANILFLLKNWYKVVWKIDPDSWEELIFSTQGFIEKIINIKKQKWDFDYQLDSIYIFQKS